ncbi:HAMP domain-containing histidine kinase, partial [bacterium]|nr:HAMP domain-containing histidine kinase [bacterium]
EKARISFFDNGPGISGEERLKIFDRFYQTGTSLAHKTKGFGLGLSIVKQLVKMHGGKISVQSPPEGKKQGAEFTVTLPLAAKTKRGKA